MKRLLQKLFKKKPRYEYAGIVHCGSFTFHDYYAEGTPQGTYHVWKGDQYQGEYSGSQVEIVTQLVYNQEEQ